MPTINLEPNDLLLAPEGIPLGAAAEKAMNRQLRAALLNISITVGEVIQKPRSSRAFFEALVQPLKNLGIAINGKGATMA